MLLLSQSAFYWSAWCLLDEEKGGVCCVFSAGCCLILVEEGERNKKSCVFCVRWSAEKYTERGERIGRRKPCRYCPSAVMPVKRKKEVFIAFHLLGPSLYFAPGLLGVRTGVARRSFFFVAFSREAGTRRVLFAAASWGKKVGRIHQGCRRRKSALPPQITNRKGAIAVSTTRHYTRHGKLMLPPPLLRLLFFVTRGDPALHSVQRGIPFEARSSISPSICNAPPSISLQSGATDSPSAAPFSLFCVWGSVTRLIILFSRVVVVC